MPEIFVGCGDDGQIKYLDEVPSGLACNCKCLVCDGPLVARKGMVNEWHFAHENGQDHVSCIAGARNFLRRIAADVLLQCPHLVSIAPHLRDVCSGHLHQSVAVGDEIAELEILATSLGSKVGVATVVAKGFTARERIPFRLHVAVEGERSNLPCEGDAGILLVQLPLLSSAVLRSKESTRQAISDGLTACWHYLPSSHSVIGRALRDLQERVATDKVIADQRVQSQELQDWARYPTQSPVSRIAPRPISAHDHPLLPVLPQPAMAEPPVWTSIYIKESALFCHRFNDGSYWLLGQSALGWLLHPWLWSEDGWDESLPASVGTPHTEFEGYICGRSTLEAMERVRPYSLGMRNTRDPKELYREFVLLGWRA